MEPAEEEMQFQMRIPSENQNWVENICACIWQTQGTFSWGSGSDKEQKWYWETSGIIKDIIDNQAKKQWSIDNLQMPLINEDTQTLRQSKWRSARWSKNGKWQQTYDL